jgi:hypothetical protein
LLLRVAQCGALRFLLSLSIVIPAEAGIQLFISLAIPLKA